MTQVGKFSTDLGRLPVKHVSMDLGETLNTSTFMLERTQVEETRLPPVTSNMVRPVAPKPEVVHGTTKENIENFVEEILSSSYAR